MKNYDVEALSKFPIGSRVKVVAPGDNYPHFKGELGTVIGYGSTPNGELVTLLIEYDNQYVTDSVGTSCFPERLQLVIN
jgi:hypothetical protein